ncbi:MAG: adenylate kinase [Alphaproteobacteria bacterium]
MQQQENGHNIILVGPPGSGKGTQAQLLTRWLHIPHLSTGDMLRQAAATGSELGLHIKALIDGGNFVSDEVMTPFVVEKLNSEECKGGFILDGFPRNLPQAELLDKLLEEKKQKIDVVIKLQVPDSYVINRILHRAKCAKCGFVYQQNDEKNAVCPSCGEKEFTQRADDNEQTIKARLKTYRLVTSPVIPYYEEKGILVCIDGTGSIKDVASRIREALKE